MCERERDKANERAAATTYNEHNVVTSEFKFRKEVISDLKRENQFLSKEIWESI